MQFTWYRVRNYYCSEDCKRTANKNAVRFPGKEKRGKSLVDMPRRQSMTGPSFMLVFRIPGRLRTLRDIFTSLVGVSMGGYYFGLDEPTLFRSKGH